MHTDNRSSHINCDSDYDNNGESDDDDDYGDAADDGYDDMLHLSDCIT